MKQKKHISLCSLCNSKSGERETDLHGHLLHAGAVDHLGTLHHIATHCNTLQHTATHCNTLQHTATHCNKLQHTATHCNTLQHLNSHLGNAVAADDLRRARIPVTASEPVLQCVAVCCSVLPCGAMNSCAMKSTTQTMNSCTMKSTTQTCLLKQSTRHRQLMKVHETQTNLPSTS